MPYLRVATATLRLFIKPLWKSSANVDKVRRRFRLLDRLSSTWLGTSNVKHETIGGVKVEWIRRSAPSSKGIIAFFHGGAFCVRGEKTDRRFCRAISDITGLPVVLVPYRLAPEHPFPCGLEDCLAVLAKLSAVTEDSTRVVVLGHSAGANLALSAMMKLRDQGNSLPVAAVLLSVPTDLTDAGKSAASNLYEDSMIDDAVWPWIARHYLPGGNPENPAVSPIFGNWRGLPPLSFHVSASEALLNDTLRAVEKAKSESVAVEVEIWNNMPHNFEFLDGLREATACRQQISAFISNALSAH